MKILITGICGFVGINLIESLKEFSEIIGIDILTSNVNLKIFHWKDLEINPSSFEDCDVIIHLAGKAHDVKRKSIPQDYFEVNTHLTQKIYDFFLNSSAAKFIFFSSVKAAADYMEGEILTENVIPKPVGPYGESKMKAEEYILKKLPLDKHVYILRPAMIHGPGNKGNLNLLYNIVNKGIPWPLGDFENKRSFTSIDNVCYILKKIINNDIPSGIYNISDDEPISTNELISIIGEAKGKKVSIWKINKWVMRTLANMGSFLYLPLNKERLNKLTENYVVSNQKIKKALKITTLPVNAREGLFKTIRSFEK